MALFWLAWLFAVVSTCSSKSVRNEARMLRGKQAFMSRISVHSGNVTLPDDSVTALDLEAQAKDDFVRRCRVSMTVSHKSFLPVRAMDSICSSTDAVVECKLQMDKMEEYHKGKSDMGLFCADIYQWFMQKYGMNCPNQCIKMQCRGTCLWLKQKKALDAQSQELNEMTNASLVDKSKLDSFKKLNASLNVKKKAQEKEVSTAYAEYVYAETNSTDQQKYALHALEREKEMSANVSYWESKLVEGKESLNEAEDALMKKTFTYESAEQKHKEQVQEVARDKAALQELSEKAKEVEVQVSRLASEISSSTEKKSSFEKTLADVQGLIDKQESVVKAKELALEQAKKTYNDQGTDEAEELVSNQEARLTEEKYKLHQLTKEYASVNNSLSFAKYDIQDYTTELDKAKKEGDVVVGSISDMQKAIDGKSITADAYFKAEVEPLKAEVSQDQTSVAKQKADQDKLEQTLEFWRKAEGERTRSREKIQEAEKEAMTKAAKKKTVLQQEEGSLDEIKSEIDENTARYEAAAAPYQREIDGIADERTELDQKYEDLFSQKPAIVTMHQLG